MFRGNLRQSLVFSDPVAATVRERCSTHQDHLSNTKHC